MIVSYFLLTFSYISGIKVSEKDLSNRRVYLGSTIAIRRIKPILLTMLKASLSIATVSRVSCLALGWSKWWGLPFNHCRNCRLPLCHRLFFNKWSMFIYGSSEWLLGKCLRKLLVLNSLLIFPPLLMLSWQWRQVALVMSTVLITKCFHTLPFLFMLRSAIVAIVCMRTRAVN